MLPSSQKTGQPSGALGALLGISLLTFFVFFVYGAEAVPAVNESHYLLKAYVAYHPEPLTRDIFLGSADTHWLFFRLSGVLTLFCSLDVTAWILRISGWLLLAWGWGRLVLASKLPGIAAPFLAAAWLCGLHYGQLSGEWVVGGAEAKVFAYGFVFLGWSYLFGEKAYRAWPWLGLASAFHVLVGGWAVVVAAIALAIVRFRSCQRTWKQHVIMLLLGGVLSLPGLVPALQTMRGVSAEDNALAAEIYVYQRIPHHLCFSKFSEKRRIAFVTPLVGFLVASIAFQWIRNKQKAATELNIKSSESKDSSGVGSVQVQPDMLSVVAVWLALGSATLLLAGVGILIEQVGYRTDPILAAKLLKFYWFRLVDPLIPMSALFAASILIHRAGCMLPPRQAEVRYQFLSVGYWIVLIALGGYVLNFRFQQLTSSAMAEANFRSLPVRDLGPDERDWVYQDWLSVCRWISANTPEDTLWLTPRHQQTFKWYTRRNEVACWKDIPQDSKSMVEWWQRIQDCYPKDENDEWAPWTTQKLLELRNKYGIRYVLIDRNIHEEPPLLPLVYPLNGQWNDHYAVFEIRP